VHNVLSSVDFLSAAERDFGLPEALWLAVEQTGMFGALEALWPAPRSGPSPARYLLLAASPASVNRGPKPRWPIATAELVAPPLRSEW
jgi:hypothetical protein